MHQLLKSNSNLLQFRTVWAGPKSLILRYLSIRRLKIIFQIKFFFVVIVVSLCHMQLLVGKNGTN